MNGHRNSGKASGRVKGRAELYLRLEFPDAANGVTREFKSRLAAWTAVQARNSTGRKERLKGGRQGGRCTEGGEAAAAARIHRRIAARTAFRGRFGAAAGAAAGLAGVLLSRGPEAACRVNHGEMY